MKNAGFLHFSKKKKDLDLDLDLSNLHKLTKKLFLFNFVKVISQL